MWFFFCQIPRQLHTLLLRFCCGAWPSVRLSWGRVLQLWWPHEKLGSARLPVGSWNLGNSRKYRRHNFADNPGKREAGYDAGTREAGHKARTRETGPTVFIDKSGGVWFPDGHLPSDHRHKRHAVAGRVFQTRLRLEGRFRVPTGRRTIHVIQWSFRCDADPHHFRQTCLCRVSVQQCAANFEKSLRLVCCHLVLRNRHLMSAGDGDGIFFRRGKWGWVLRSFIGLPSAAVIRGQTSRLGVFRWLLHRLEPFRFHLHSRGVHCYILHSTDICEKSRIDENESGRSDGAEDYVYRPHRLLLLDAGDCHRDSLTDREFLRSKENSLRGHRHLRIASKLVHQPDTVHVLRCNRQAGAGEHCGTLWCLLRRQV